MAHGSKATAAAVDVDARQRSELTIIREQTRECLELLRALVGLLVNKPERKGKADASPPTTPAGTAAQPGARICRRS